MSAFDEDSRSPSPQGPSWLDEPADETRLLTRDRQREHLTLAPDDEPSPEPVLELRHPHRHHEHDERRRSKRLRRLLIALVVLIVLGVIGLIVAGLWARHAMRAALPQLDGTLAVSGLHAPVHVERNAQGVPYIQASNTNDLLFAQGFVTAQDRLWQMDALRRHASGELAEILGPALIQHDTMQRTLQIREAADRAVQSIPPDRLHEFEAYARGVNAYIHSAQGHLPLEFRLLHYTPRPWTPRDSLLVSLVMWQDLSTGFPEKLDREALSQHLPQALLADLYPVGSWRDHPPAQLPADLTAPHEVEQIPLDRSQSRLALPSAAPRDLLALTSELGTNPCEGCRAGSNNWVVAGSHSASGSALVSNDMHLGLSAPDIWYEASLHVAASTPDETAIDVEGFTLPGIPWVLVGRNAHVAWGLTNLAGDVQDLRIEHLRGSGSSLQYERADRTWAPVVHRTEHIVVRGARDRTLDVQLVEHPIGSATIESPIISPLFHSERRALSLDWPVYDPSSLNASFAQPDAARSAADLVASFASYRGVSLNLIYADDQGHIGYHAIGRIPIRGPAVQHPRAVQPFVLPPPEPDSDDDEDSGDSASQNNFQDGPPAPTAYFPQSSPAHLILASATRHRRRRARPAPRSSSHPAPQRKAAPIPAAQPATPAENLPPQPDTESFTIGSPLSPVPVDALDAAQLWSGYIPFNELPAVEDPSSGILATANSRITTDVYPYAIALNWADPYRVERIYRLLDQHAAWTPQQMLGLETDQHSEFDLALAQRLAYAIDHSSAHARGNDSPRLRRAADLLRTFNGDMTPGSPAAAIVAATHDNLWSALLVPQLQAHDRISRNDALRLAHLYLWGESTTALEDLLQHTPKRWLPPGVANWDDLLTAILEQSLHDTHAPRDLSRWSYAAIHQIRIEHPLFAGRLFVQWLLGTPTGSGPQPIGGDATTIDATGRAFGPSERFTADLSSPSATLANVTTGESGNPASPWYLDQLQPWLRGTSFALPLQPAHTDHTLLLVPGS